MKEYILRPNFSTTKDGIHLGLEDSMDAVFTICRFTDKYMVKNGNVTPNVLILRKTSEGGIPVNLLWDTFPFIRPFLTGDDQFMPYHRMESIKYVSYLTGYGVSHAGNIATFENHQMLVDYTDLLDEYLHDMTKYNDGAFLPFNHLKTKCVPETYRMWNESLLEKTPW